jgi:hypothetical protein
LIIKSKKEKLFYQEEIFEIEGTPETPIKVENFASNGQ